MKINMFDKVRLQNGKVGVVVEIYHNPTLGYCIDVDNETEQTTYDVFPEEIASVVDWVGNSRTTDRGSK